MAPQPYACPRPPALLPSRLAQLLTVIWSQDTSESRRVAVRGHHLSKQDKPEVMGLREARPPGKGRSFLSWPMIFCTRWNSALTLDLLRDFFLPEEEEEEKEEKEEVVVAAAAEARRKQDPLGRCKGVDWITSSMTSVRKASRAYGASVRKAGRAYGASGGRSGQEGKRARGWAASPGALDAHHSCHRMTVR